MTQPLPTSPRSAAAAEKAGYGVGPQPETHTALSGRGVQARVDGHEVVLGNRALMDEYAIQVESLTHRAETLAAAGATPMYVAIDSQPAGVIAVADSLKPESRPALAQLRALGLDVWMLTGDNLATAQAIARPGGHCFRSRHCGRAAK